jgi:hypothetical protein
MRLRCRRLLLFAAALALAAPGVAQKPTTKPDSEDFQKGFTEFETFQGEANSDSSVLKLDSTVGYDFNKNFGVFAGVPVYFSHVASTTGTGTTTISSGGTGMGNVYLGFALRAPNPTLDYSSTVTAAAPTGDTKKGLSTGRASIDWDNRFEHSFDRLTPFFDGGLANTVPDSVFLTRRFTSLGAITHLEEGADFDLVRHFSVGGSAYQIVPFGNQKIFSRLARRGQSPASGSGLTRENGFSTWVGFEPTPFWRAEIGYTRSTTFGLNSLAFNLRVNFGKLLRPRKTS